MSKKLFYVLILVLITNFGFSQTKTWDFGNDASTWPLSAGIGNDPMVVDNLGLFPIPTNTNFGAITSNNLTFEDGYSATRRFQMNGGGYPSGEFSTMPTQRYLFFGVSGSCTVKVWFRTGSNGTQRTLHFTNGSSVLGEITTNANGNGDFPIFTGTYTGGAATLYLYGSLALNLYKIEVTGATVSTSLSEIGQSLLDEVQVISNYKEVSLYNVKENLNVNVYDIKGSLIKSFNTNNDISFNLDNTGVYFIKMNADSGSKTEKVLVK